MLLRTATDLVEARIVERYAVRSCSASRGDSANRHLALCNGMLNRLVSNGNAPAKNTHSRGEAVLNGQRVGDVSWAKFVGVLRACLVEVNGERKLQARTCDLCNER